MATTQHFYNGTGSQASFNVTFDFIKQSEIKVKVSGVNNDFPLPQLTHYNIDTTTSPITVVFTSGNIPALGTNNVNIYRDTDVDTSAVIYGAGSSIKADDLNKNQKQLLHAIQELELVSPNSSGLVLSTGTKNDITVNDAGDWEIVDDQVENKHLAPNAVGNTEIIDDSIAEVKLDIHNAPSTGKVLRYTSNGMEWADEVSTVPTQITVADESSDTQCFPLFTTESIGNEQPKTGSNLTFNSATGALTATTFSGPVTGDVTGNVTGDVTGNVTGNITGNVLGSGSIASTITATTQATSDNSTKIATTAYVKASIGESEKPIGLKLGSLRPNVSTVSLLSASLPTSIAKYGVGNSQTSNILGLYGGNYISANGKSYCWGHLLSDVHGSWAVGGSGNNPVVYTPVQQQVRLPGYFMRAVGGNSDDSKFLTDLNGTSLGYTTISQPKIINTYLNRANQYCLLENGILLGSGADDYSVQGNNQTSTNGRTAFLPVQFYDTSGNELLGTSRPKIKQFSMSSTGDDFPDTGGKGDRIALDTDGNVYTWGMNQFGQAGRGFNDAGADNAVRKKAQRITHSWSGTPIYVYAEGGESSSVFVITSTGKLYSWGHNDQGQLGINSTSNNVNVPQEVTAVASDLKTRIDAGAKVVHVLTTGGHTAYRRSYVLTNEGKVYACGNAESPVSDADRGVALGYHVSDNADQLVFNECTLVTAQLTYTNEKIVSLWSTGGDSNTNYVITDGGTENKPRVISWGHNTHNQLARGISTTSTADASSVGVWTPGEIEFQTFGDMERMSTGGTTVNDITGTMYHSNFSNKHKFGRPVAIVSNKHQSDDQCMVVLIDDLGQLYVAGDNEEHAMVNYPEFDNDSQYNGTSSIAERFVPVWQQPEPITDLCFNSYDDGNASWTAIGTSGIVYTGGEGYLGQLGLGGMYTNNAGETTYNTGGFHPLAIST